MKNNCPFCQSGKGPDYKQGLFFASAQNRQPEVLKQYLSDQGKIVKRLRTGICVKHQKKLGQAIKQARFLGLLPFTTRV